MVIIFNMVVIFTMFEIQTKLNPLSLLILSSADLKYFLTLTFPFRRPTLYLFGAEYKTEC